MNTKYLQPHELERLAYIQGDALTAMQAAEIADTAGDVENLESDVDNALDLVGCSGKRGDVLYAALHDIGEAHSHTLPLFEATLTAIADAFLQSGPIPKKRLTALGIAIQRIVRAPEYFAPDRASGAVQTALGMGA